MSSTGGKWFSTFGAKLSLLVLCASTLPVLASTSIGYAGGKRQLEAEAAELLRARAEALAAEIDAFHARHQRGAELLARAPGVVEFCRGGPAEHQRTGGGADAAMAPHSDDAAVRAVSIIGADATILRSTEAGAAGLSVANRDYARRALAGKATISDLLVPITPADLKPVLVYSNPVLAADGSVACAVILAVRAEGLWTAVRATNGRAGEGSFSMLVDQYGIRIAHSSHDRHLFRPAAPLEPAVRQALIADRRFGDRTAQLLDDVLPAPDLEARSRGAALGELDRPFHLVSATNQQRNVAVARRTRLAPWTLFVLLPESTVTGAARTLFTQALATGTLIAALALLVGYLFICALRRPLRELAAATDALAGGDLSARAPADTRDEIGQLGRRFNQMADAVAAAAEGLEASVAERTADLATANSTLEQQKSELMVQRAELLAQREELLVAQAQLLAQQTDLENKNRMVERATALKSEFLANMSHELRTPLNAIIGFSDLLLTPGGETLSAKQSERVRHVLDSGRHLLELINDVLDLSKIEAGRLELETQELDAPTELADALQLMRPVAAKKGVNLIQVGEPGVVVRADRAKLRQVLLNLLSNAVKFSPDGGTVEVGAKAIASGAELWVSDSGPGIPEAFRPRLFEPFAQAESPLVKRHGGTGLGLAITRRLVDAHGGQIEAESTPGRGATFRVRLPSEPSGPISLSRGQGARALGISIAELAAAPPAAGGLVLVIDDDARVVEVLSALLGAEGFRVEGAVTGRSALAAARRERPTLVIVDLELPDIPGREVIAALHDDPALSAVPLVVLTGGELDAETRRWLKPRVRAVAQKGDLTSGELLATVRKHTLHPSTAAGPAGTARRVLIVDDHDLNRTLARELVEGMGHTVLDADGADAALALARIDPPDLVLMDLSMPGKDGFQALAELRAEPTTATIPVIALTAHAMRGDEQAALAAGFDAYVSKPVDSAALRKEVARLLGR